MKTLALASLLLSSSSAAAADFRGHYGYRVDVPSGYSSASGLKGEAEIALFYPERCMRMTLGECYRAGLIELVVIPKAMAKTEAGISDFDNYVEVVLQEAGKAGLGPTSKRGTTAGLPSALIEMSDHPEAMDAMRMVEGEKFYYRFKFNRSAGADASAVMASSLREAR